MKKILAVADACTVETAAADRVKISAYQWRAAKLAPRKYGDRQQIEQRFVDGDGKDRPLTLADIDRMRAEPESDSE